jgi:hypothetical protein
MSYQARWTEYPTLSTKVLLYTQVACGSFCSSHGRTVRARIHERSHVVVANRLLPVELMDDMLGLLTTFGLKLLSWLLDRARVEVVLKILAQIMVVVVML